MWPPFPMSTSFANPLVRRLTYQAFLMSSGCATVGRFMPSFEVLTPY